MLSELSAGRVYHVRVGFPQAEGSEYGIVDFEATLTGVFMGADRTYKLNFGNGVELQVQVPLNVVFYTKIY
jgi:hypothetical protein